jgi:DNA-binding transcriptional ArsR family regulator
MEGERAVRILGALAQEHRLAAFRLLVQAGRPGMAAGEIVTALGIAPSSASFHLAQLVNAGLATQTRHGRSIRYAPNYAVVGNLVGYLVENCSGGQGCGEVPGCGADAPALPACCGPAGEKEAQPV